MKETTSDGRLWAALAYGAVFTGLPLGIIPLAMQEDEFAVYHARHIVAVQVAFLIAFGVLMAVGFVLGFVTCGLGYILILPIVVLLAFWPLATGIHGLLLAINGEWQEPILSFGLGEKYLSNIVAKPKDGAEEPKQITQQDEPAAEQAPPEPEAVVDAKPEAAAAAEAEKPADEQPEDEKPADSGDPPTET
jgi:hypothetical protein